MLKSVLVIGAHPDDETVMAGGTLAMLARQNIDVHLVCATRGEGGEMGEPPICTREELGGVRSAELECAGQALGAATVGYLGYIDPVCIVDGEVYAFEADYETLIAQIRGLIEDKRANVVLSHGSDGEYGHPAHKLLHRAVMDAVHGTNVLFYNWAAVVPGIEDRVWNQSDRAHLAIDVRDWLDQKAAALDCHKTQHYLFLRRRENAATMYDVARKTEGFHRHWPPIDSGSPDDAFAQLMRAAGAWTPEFDEKVDQ
jgi:N-acetylglucosamine malate deacetylase 2